MDSILYFLAFSGAVLWYEIARRVVHVLPSLPSRLAWAFFGSPIRRYGPNARPSYQQEPPAPDGLSYH